VFTLAGVGAFLLVPALRDRKGDPELLLRIAEAGLVLLLFTDASRTDLRVLRSIRSLPVRLLTTGMLSTLVLGALGALAVFPALSLWEAGVLSAILAPTDAGLGQIVVSSEKVPMRIRQALNVEAGLNDGLSVPFLLFFLAVARSGGEGGGTRLSAFIVEQLGYGAAIGLGIGLAGGWLLGRANRRGAVQPAFRQIALVALPLLCAAASEATGASMFIAAFVCGLAVQPGFREAGEESVEFTEEWGQVFNLFVFFLFGLLVARAGAEFSARTMAYAVLSLTVVRMLPVALALRGTGLSRASVVFMGWFGPRGLASIVLGLVYLEGDAHLPGERSILLTVMATVLLSIFAHGLTAKPGIARYATKVAALGPDAPERKAVGGEA
jgi:NhaP-type Na+/H+ or K+/H+ antiporter